MKKDKKILNVVIGIGGLILLWQIASMIQNVGKTTIPSPIDAIKALIELQQDELLFSYIGISLYRFFIGYTASVLVGVTLGIVLGWYKRAWNIIDPIVQFLRPISPIAWFPFIVVIFGIGNLPAIVIIFIAGFFQVLLSTVMAIRKIDKIYFKVSDNFEIKGIKRITKIIIPCIFPQIVSAMHISLGSAWIFLVSGEMVGAQSGLGYLIIDARNNLRLDMLLAGILLIGVIGILLDKLIEKIEKRVISIWGGVI